MEYISHLFNFYTLLLVFMGTLGGIFIGVLPGLSGPTGVALLLPFTFAMTPVNGLLMLGGLYMGSSYGGSISAILLNAPGTEYAAATALDGFPLMRQGRGKEALYYSLSASAVGGIIGVGALITMAPYLAKVALKFGPPEMFLLAAAGLAIIGALAGKNISKGIIAGALGVLISTVGEDIGTGFYRLTFGMENLECGIPLVPALVGLFAVTEMINQSLNIKNATLSNMPMQEAAFMPIFKNMVKRFKSPLWKGSFLGTIIGVMPGAGATVASFIAYGEAKRASKTPEKFGNGSLEGIVAAESANNASVGGALVPLLSLGIPGSTTTAILYGALTIHGLVPGPRLFVENPEVAYPFLFGMLLTVVIMVAIGIVGANYFTKVMYVPVKILVPVILTLCFLGAYSINNSVFDILLTILFGLLGVLFKRISIPIAPIVLGIILGPIGEESLRQSMVIASAHGKTLMGYVIGRPISIILFLLLLAVLGTSFSAFMKMKKN